MLPHELVARYLSPLVKALVAHRLSGHGLGQERVARLLGVSQPMVSKYLRRSLGELLDQLAEIGVGREEALSVADTLASLLLRGDLVGYYSLFTSFANSVLSRGLLCRLHRSRHGAPEACSICLKLFSSSSDAVIEEVREAVRRLTSTPGAGRLVPNVGSNIVAARPGARSINDVVGLTGAIVRVGDSAVAVGEPVYGGSRHTAQVLLLAMRLGEETRAAIVIRYTSECVKRLSSAGLRVIETGPHREASLFLEDVRRRLEEAGTGGGVDVIADLGGVGLEPVIYVFASTAVEAVERALLCL